MSYYNTGFAEGRWAHFMDQVHIGYSGWNDPPEDTLGSLALAEAPPRGGAGLGVAVEGSEDAWPGPEGIAVLPRFDSINCQSQYVEVFDRGTVPFDYVIRSSDPWIEVRPAGGTAGHRLGFGGFRHRWKPALGILI